MPQENTIGVRTYPHHQSFSETRGTASIKCSLVQNISPAVPLPIAARNFGDRCLRKIQSVSGLTPITKVSLKKGARQA
ncbi:hypothetical protein [Microseira wollei]|uniref:hypothetical protein n=1 Tax=Microseira wollei TaxID=467598 RepID=UPI001CFCA01A|nr:hypothetical protein [Microseira wollei]